MYMLLTEEETEEYRDLFNRLHDKGIYVSCTFTLQAYIKGFQR